MNWFVTHANSANAMVLIINFWVMKKLRLTSTNVDVQSHKLKPHKSKWLFHNSN